MNIYTLEKPGLFISVIAGLFIFDEVLLPVFHPAGIPIKISYFISLAWIIFHYLRIRVNRQLSCRFDLNSRAYTITNRFLYLILLSCLGELTMYFFSDRLNTEPFYTAILYYLFMLAAFGVGYTLYNFDTKVLIYVLYLYCIINIGMLMFYDALPGIVKQLYAGDYLASGIRIRGTGGNANTTLLVMNTILLSIVLLNQINKLDVKGVHFWLVFLVPILTNFFISSRGEFVGTILLELMFLYNVIRLEKNKGKTIFRIAVLAVLIIIAYIVVFKVLYYTNSAIRYGIDRLATLGEVDLAVGEDDTDSILRPFIKFDVFWARFKHSPIWGAGYSYGTTADFIKSANGYHNDWFRVLASTGILGFLLWFKNEKKFYQIGGICVLIPICIAGLTNTFIRSVHAFNIYFFTMGVLVHWSEFGCVRELRKSRIRKINGV